MSTVLIAASPDAAMPLVVLPVVEAFISRGHRVVFVAGEELRERAEALGAAFVSVPAVAPASGVRTSRVLPGIQQIDAHLRERFLRPLPDQWRTVRSLLAQERVDVVVTDPLFLGASLLCLLPSDRRPPVIVLGCVPLPFEDPEVAPFGLGLAPLESVMNRPRNLLLQMLLDHVLLRRVARELRIAAEALTGARLPSGIFAMPGFADVWAQLTVPRFEYPRARTPDNVRFVGPLRPALLGSLPDWWYERDERPLVYICHDPSSDPRDLTLPAIEALADADVQVVVTADSDAARIRSMIGGRGPDDLRIEPFIPFPHLLPETAVMITHGIYSLVQHGLRWGVPLVVAGTAEEQVEVNARVEWSGVGVQLRSSRPNPAAIRSAVDRVMQDGAVRIATARIAAQIAATDAQAALCDIAEELVADRPRPLRLPA